MGMTSSEMDDLGTAICRYNGVLAGSHSERMEPRQFWRILEAIEALREEDKGFVCWLISLGVHDLSESRAGRILVTEEGP